MKKIELSIIALANSDSNPEQFTLVLEEQGGSRRLPINIGAYEAQAIAISMERMQLSRPLTHDLFKNTIIAAGITITEVLISEMVDGVFHACLIGRNQDGSSLKVDARSSDAIAMALRCDCPIYATDLVLQEAGVSGNSRSRKRYQLVDYSIQELQDLLERVLEKEDYESASKIRDIINEKKLN